MDFLKDLKQYLIRVAPELFFHFFMCTLQITLFWGYFPHVIQLQALTIQLKYSTINHLISLYSNISWSEMFSDVWVIDTLNEVRLTTKQGRYTDIIHSQVLVAKVTLELYLEKKRDEKFTKMMNKIISFSLTLIYRYRQYMYMCSCKASRKQFFDINISLASSFPV